MRYACYYAPSRKDGEARQIIIKLSEDDAKFLGSPPGLDLEVNEEMARVKSGGALRRQSDGTYRGYLRQLLPLSSITDVKPQRDQGWLTFPLPNGGITPTRAAGAKRAGATRSHNAALKRGYTIADLSTACALVKEIAQQLHISISMDDQGNFVVKL